MGEPVFFFGESFIDAIVEILVVRKDDMASNVVELGFGLVALKVVRVSGTHKAFRGGVGRGKPTWCLVGVYYHPRRTILRNVSQLEFAYSR